LVFYKKGLTVFSRKSLFLLARPKRFERSTDGFVVRYSIQLSYGRNVFLYIGQTGDNVNDNLTGFYTRMQFEQADIGPASADRIVMKMALSEATSAFKEEEVPVGAVLISESGTVLASTHNQTISLSDPTAHAEILALRHAAKQIQNYRLLNTTLYVTVEPCMMCMGAIIHARVGRLVYGARDPRWGAAGSLFDLSIDKRLNHSLEVISGVCEAECREILQHFFRDRRSHPSG
jgi:tRNA(adenine34) deaminase